MIAMVAASVILAASWQTAAAVSARQQLVKCLRDASTKAQADKVAPDAFTAFAHTACATQESALAAAIWAFDSKNKVSRKQSEADAQLQIEDYLATAEDRYRISIKPQQQAQQQPQQPAQPQQ